jgi:Cu2+-exporting ATPase
MIDTETTLAACAHCGLPAAQGRRFCCPGCAAAHDIIQDLGLGDYYRQRAQAGTDRALRPEPPTDRDLARHVTARPDGTHELTLAVDGIQCGACVWLIESVLARAPGLTQGRVNMTTRRLRLAWSGEPEDAARHVARIEALGYRLVPFDTASLNATQDRTSRALLRALAVSGFAAGNVMLLSIGIWAGQTGLFGRIGPATLSLLHWVSALIAMPAIAYAGRPFFASAITALRQCRTNMDVPVSIGVLLVTGLSLQQTIAGGADTYFDSAVALIFFLLLGRTLDHRARGRARATAEQLLALRATDVTVIAPDGTASRRPQDRIEPGARILVASGERIGVDGHIESGTTTLDAGLVTGESLPIQAAPGAKVYAGTLNLGPALTIRATATGTDTLLAECARLIEAACARRGRFVVLADRVAASYAPAVHLCALLTFLGWYFLGSATAGEALLTAAAVLIVTCPCALALAVPAVQVIAAGRLFQSGTLLKSATALERLAQADTVVFDKTGTLTQPLLALEDCPDQDALHQAAAIAASSRHPLARALVLAAGRTAPASDVTEHPGQGLEHQGTRLGSARFCGTTASTGAELWLSRPGHPPVRFAFQESLRPGAARTIAALRRLGLSIHLLSGDRPNQVAAIAALLGIQDWQAARSPADKVAVIEALRAQGRHVLMVGDGLNDGPALAAANVSASPSSAADVSQTVADLVFQGASLFPVAAAIRTARRASATMRQNLALAIGYNIVMVPLAAAGLVTPWVAAAAMSGSSLLVMANSLRLCGPLGDTNP